MVVAFLLLASLVFYVYVGYPLTLRLTRPRLRPRHPAPATPHVTLFIPAHNEALVIRQKLINSLSIDYPPDRLQVALASDASDDETVSIAKTFSDPRLVIFEARTRKGKNGLINDSLPFFRGDIIVFTDANTMLNRHAIRQLAAHFSDERVGCVVGHLKYVDTLTPAAKGEGLYFRYEAMIKSFESAHGTLAAATGSLYAVRRELCLPLDLDIANDLMHPIHAISHGYKVLFEPEAVATEKATSSSSEEFRRRARIVTRGLTAFFRHCLRRRMLMGMWGFCFISHKLLRWFVPLYLLALFALSLPLASESSTFRLILYMQLAFYALAAATTLQNGRAPRFLSVPFYFCLVNAAALVGLWDYLAGRRQAVWDPARSTR